MKHWFVLGFMGFVLAGVAGCGGDDDDKKCNVDACSKCITDALTSNNQNADCSSACKGCEDKSGGTGGSANNGAGGGP